MIHQISLSDCLESTAPPGRVLNISALDDVAFVRICSVKQDHQSETHAEEIADISVSLPSLLEALQVLINDQEREHLRPLDHDGKSKETRIAGERFSLAPLGFNAIAGARTLHRRYTAPPEEAAGLMPAGPGHRGQAPSGGPAEPLARNVTRNPRSG